jgi:hypothetical protein
VDLLVMERRMETLEQSILVAAVAELLLDLLVAVHQAVKVVLEL